MGLGNLANVTSMHELHGDNGARPDRVRPVGADGSVLRILGLLEPGHHLCVLHLGAAQRGVRLGHVLQLPVNRGRQRHGLVELEHGVCLLPHRYGEYAGVHDLRIATTFELACLGRLSSSTMNTALRRSD